MPKLKKVSRWKRLPFFKKQAVMAQLTKDSEVFFCSEEQAFFCWNDPHGLGEVDFKKTLPEFVEAVLEQGEADVPDRLEAAMLSLGIVAK